MDVATQPLPSGKRASVSEAKFAYFEGDFERCLAICAEIKVRSLSTASEVALLSARAFLRTGRAAEAEAAVDASSEMHGSLDASLTAQMLLAVARIRQADPDGGIALLEVADARSAEAHLAIRSEIAFATALGYWAKRDIDAAERHLARVDRRSDIIHARALELGAWCQSARGNYRRSAEYFILTLLRLDSCRAQDRAIVATAISTLSILGAELFDPEIARVVEHRARGMEWTSGLVTHQYITVLHQALFAEIAGNTVEAYELSMQARAMAPNAAFEVYTWAIGASIAHNAGESHIGATFAARARRLLGELELRELTGEERFSILAVAETSAPHDIEAAERFFAAYWGLAPADKMMALSDDPRLAAEETYVAGVIAHGRGDVESAVRCYRQAFADFDRVGYVRRAAMAAFALIKLDADADAVMLRYVHARFNRCDNFITRQMRGRFADSEPCVAAHPIVRTLPRAQREVVSLICQGKTNKEIAHLRNVGEQTIKNMLTKHVFRAFGVSSRAALVSACLRVRA